MLNLKPFLRISLFSLMLSVLLIILGVKYHWGEKLGNVHSKPQTAPLPENVQGRVNDVDTVTRTTSSTETDAFSPRIIVDHTDDSILSSLTKSQINAECARLMAMQNSDPMTLELATINCMVSNYQETFQSTATDSQSIDVVTTFTQRQQLLQQNCRKNLSSSTHLSEVQQALSVGICVSDNLNK